MYNCAVDTRAVDLVMPQPPTGTETFLFTDIEGSTRSWDSAEDATSKALARHDAILRGCVEEHGGVVFKMVGDAGCAAFPTAPEALRAAIAIQQSIAGESWEGIGELRARMALHTGAAEERDGDYFGPPLNRVARLLAAGHGGQVLLSMASHELVRDRLPDGVTLMDLGEHRLKDLTRPEHVFQVVIPELLSGFPELKTLDARLTNLPIQQTPLVGREKEVRGLCDLIRDDGGRLVTLTGPAGTGKTRLALQVGAELLEEFQDGVYFVSLGSVSDPELVVPAIASVLDVREVGAKSVAEILPSYLKHKEMLLILDNFEQVVESSAQVAGILQDSPGVTALVTSRTVLHLYGERQHAVPPMTLPDLKDLPVLEKLSQYESVALFIQRARAAKRDFQVTNENAPAVAAICCRLDGLPLAIELAAARVNLLPSQGILDRLSDRMKLLTGGGKDLPERHQTLRAAIEWSYGLLEEHDQKLFRRLGVFLGGWTLEAAEAVSNPDQDLDVFEGMASLVERSLVRQTQGLRDEPRFDMLETITEFACDQQEEASEVDAMGHRHAEYFLAFAESASPELVGPVARLDRLEIDHDNLRSALSWFAENDRCGEATAMAAALWQYWWVRGLREEGRKWIDRLLDSCPNQSIDRANLCLGAGMLAIEQGDLGAASRYQEEGLRLASALGDEITASRILMGQGLNAQMRGDLVGATALYEESLDVARKLNLRHQVGTLLRQLGRLAADQEEYGRAASLVAESVAIHRSLDDANELARDLATQGWLAEKTGDLNQAWRFRHQSLALAHHLGHLEVAAYDIVALGRLAERQGYIEQSVSLFALATRLCGPHGVTIAGPEKELTDAAAERTRDTLSEDAWGSGWDRGFRLSVEQVATGEYESGPDKLVNLNVAIRGFDRAMGVE